MPRALVPAFLFVAWILPALGQVSRVDHSKANVNGNRGIGFWPNVNDAPGDPSGYEAVLAPVDQPQSWLRFSAGKWHEVPPGVYNVLMEGDFEVTPHHTVLHWSNSRYEGRGMASVRGLVAAGRVHVDGECASKQCLGWLFHESSNLQGSPGYQQPEMVRWSRFDQARTTGVLMPAGRVAAAIYDGDRKEFVAIQLPVQVKARGSTRTRPVPPRSGRAALILEMSRPSVVPEVREKDVQVALVAGDVTLQPTFITRTHRKVIAIWSDVPAGPVRVNVSSPDAHLPKPRNDLRLRSGKVERVSVALAPLPKLGVQWSIPDAFEPKDPTLKIVNLDGDVTVHTIDLARKTAPIELAVPAAPLTVTLKTGPWTVRETVDLSDGADRTIQLEMRAIRVSGRVYYGDDPVKASIAFRTDVDRTKMLEVHTDEEGRYQALFARPHAYTAWVSLQERSAPFVVPGFDVEGDTTKDIRVPANLYRFRVTRKDDGRPIAGAQISVQNHEDSADDLTVSQQLTTDERGTALAQPLRTGTVTVDVRAEGFVRLHRPEEPVLAKGERTIDLQLELVGPTDTLTLRLPTGQPAAGANVMVHGNRDIQEIDADSEGRLQIPRAETGGLVLVRSSGAALTARTWAGRDQTWTLEPPGEPLVIHAVQSDGSPAPYARAVLWLDGLRLTGVPLAWLTAKSVTTDAGGYWVLHGLPKRPLHVLMWRYTESNYELVRHERLDAMRTTIGSPWPSTVEVKILE